MTWGVTQLTEIALRRIGSDDIRHKSCIEVVEQAAQVACRHE